MTGPLATRGDVLRALEGAPAQPPSPPPATLAGWRRDGVEVCASCAGRILARLFGCGILRGWSAVSAPDAVRCCGCGLDSRPHDVETFVVLRDGAEVGRFGSEVEGWAFLHRVQPNSVEWACRHEGWAIRRVER
ncbi:MAG: hypothetical protein AB7O97_04140 [Planctomycetota bacterium]